MKIYKIFLVEDDINFGTVLRSYLEMNKYSVTWVDDGQYASEHFREQNYDICILDVMLPNVDGFTIARNIRKINPHIPFIFLTAKSLKEDILEGFKIGADDYITKPFDSEVLLYKIKAILRRKSIDQDDTRMLEIGKYTYNTAQRVLNHGDKQQKLSPKEGALLQLFANNMNKVVNRELALREIWGESTYFTTRSMDVYITKLRKYLKDDPMLHIENVHGSGYVLRYLTES
ncbi:MAG: response regulator transcription factor [Salinivirgaceae bacterium]|jgi:two-component system OmpR family response regulator|nr:response regulator transcription factor [Salinivirgaceae bacterium]